MGANFNEFRSVVREGARRAFTDIQAQHPDEDFYAFALYTDDSVMSLLPAANSEQAFVRAIEGTGATGTDDQIYMRWATAEWGYEAFDGDFGFGNSFPEAPENSGAFGAHKQQFLATLINALLDLEKEEFFGTGEAREKVTVFITISDSFEASRIEKKSIRKLNPAPVYREHVHRQT